MSKEKEAIWVWRFEDAPEEYRKMSNNGGDEDWLAVVPPSFLKELWIPWLQEGSPFGVCDVQIYTLETGHQVYIGSHS